MPHSTLRNEHARVRVTVRVSVHAGPNDGPQRPGLIPGTWECVKSHSKGGLGRWDYESRDGAMTLDHSGENHKGSPSQGLAGPTLLSSRDRARSGWRGCGHQGPYERKADGSESAEMRPPRQRLKGCTRELWKASGLWKLEKLKEEILP